MSMRSAKFGNVCKEDKRMCDNAYQDAKRNNELEFWNVVRSRKADFKKFMRVYSRVTGRGMGKGLEHGKVGGVSAGAAAKVRT